MRPSNCGTIEKAYDTGAKPQEMTESALYRSGRPVWRIRIPNLEIQEASFVERVRAVLSCHFRAIG